MSAAPQQVAALVPKPGQSAIYPALAKIQAGIHAIGIGKVRRNQDQKFNFRGVDDALAAFAPLLTEAGVFVIPSYSDIVVTERATKSGGMTYNARVAAKFTFIASDDGSRIEAGPFYAEANDGQDKGISKATSVAYRNCLFITFCVPHEPAIGGDPDGHGEAEHVFDLTPWREAIAAAVDKAGLDSLGKELKTAAGIPDAAMRNIRALWAKRAKEVAA